MNVAGPSLMSWLTPQNCDFFIGGTTGYNWILMEGKWVYHGIVFMTTGWSSDIHGMEIFMDFSWESTTNNLWKDVGMTCNDLTMTPPVAPHELSFPREKSSILSGTSFCHWWISQQGWTAGHHQFNVFNVHCPFFAFCSDHWAPQYSSLVYFWLVAS